MLIGNKYADNKLYRGIKHYDGLPLPMEDLHESMDTFYMKNLYLMNNIIGSGVTLNNPTLVLLGKTISTREPIALHVDGDVVLIQSSRNLPLYTIPDSIRNSFTLYVVGWYQHITASNAIKEYGGVDNITLPNDMIDEKLSLQISSRYQFRWCIVGKENTSNLLYFQDRDADGNIIEGTNNSIAIGELSEKLAPSANMAYAASDIYVIPLISLEYNGTTGVISSTTIIENKKTFSPDKLKFNQRIYRETIAANFSSNVVLPEFMDSRDIISVVYEGLTLIPGEEYDIIWNSSGRGTLSLKIDTKIGEILTVINNKLELNKG